MELDDGGILNIAVNTYNSKWTILGYVSQNKQVENLEESFPVKKKRLHKNV